jgi:hypothetical protein
MFTVTSRSASNGGGGNGGDRDFFGARNGMQQPVQRGPQVQRIPVPQTAPPASPAVSQPQAVDNSWAYRAPLDITELLRQLSANVGQTPMPGGRGGSVRNPAFGSPAKPEMNPDPFHYGETGGETTFFNQTTKGGMAPISALPTNLGYPADWNPLGTSGSSASATQPDINAMIKDLYSKLYPSTPARRPSYNVS